MLTTATRTAAALITPRRRASARCVLWLSTPLVVYTSAAKPIASNTGRRRMSGKRDLFVGGQWVAAKNKGKFPVYNPSTGEVWADIADAGRADAAAAIEAA